MCLSVGLHRLRECSVKQGKTGQYALRVRVYLCNGKNMESTIVYRGCIGIMGKKMETTIVYWGFIGCRVLGISGLAARQVGLPTPPPPTTQASCENKPIPSPADAPGRSVRKNDVLGTCDAFLKFRRSCSLQVN